MKFIKFIVSLAITGILIYLLNTSQELAGNTVPPLGKFFNPYGGFWYNAEDVEKPSYQGQNLSGLKDEVSIQYDEHLVPHIFAKNNHDLYMAQGFVVAQMRLWQMEFQTHAAAGRISELIGEKALNFDRLQRRKGMVTGAEATLKSMQEDSEIFDYLEAYASGVNAYISSLTYKDYPLEYKLMGYNPEEWTVLKSALILEYMIDNLTGFDNDLENTNLIGLIGKEKFDILYPEYNEGIEPTVPTDSVWWFTPLELPSDQYEPETGNIPQTLPKPNPDNGSNNWAVLGSKTKSGKPILANDTHLGLNLPSLWVMMQLHSPDVNVFGYTFTGAIGITIGFNENSAWGYTNAPRDTRDWYNITFKDGTRSQYLYDSTWKEATYKIEEIQIKGQSPFYDTVTYTHHGPVVYDKSFMGNDDGSQNYALRWTGHDGSRVQRALYQLNRTQNYDEYRKAIEYWDSPPQNIIFANTNGDIALTVQGNFPLKWRGQGKFLMDGAKPENDWGTFIPKDHSAYQLNPERGFVSSANQHSVDEAYPYYFYSSSNEYYRNRQINRLLQDMKSITVEDFMQMHMDSYSIKAEETLPFLLDSINRSSLNSEQQAIIKELTTWDYHYEVESIAASYYNVWWQNFRQLLWDELDKDGMVITYPNSYNTTQLIKNNPISDYSSNHDSLSDIITQAFILGINQLEKWSEDKEMPYTWANYKGTSIIHLSRIPAFSRNNIQIKGQADAINATKPNHGPSQRMIVELTNPPTAWGIYPGGQSGNPGSKYYDNFMEQWRDGGYIPLTLMNTPETDKERLLITYTLQPE